MYQSLQGNLGLGKAIEYFTSHSIPVSIPLNDTQKYDLVIDQDGQLKRVSVKTTRYFTNGNYAVLLKNAGGASKKKTIRHFDASTCDYVFVYTVEEKTYLIPSEIIKAKNSQALGQKYDEYIVNCKPFAQFAESMET